MIKREKLQKRLAYFAKKHLGKPYKYGSLLSGAPRVFDCSSFIQYLYKRIGINLPRTALEQAHLGKHVNSKKLEIGDLIFIKGKVGHYDPEFPEGIGHVVIYVGNNKIINAKYKKNKNGSDGGMVKEGLASELLNRDDVITIKRII